MCDLLEGNKDELQRYIAKLELEKTMFEEKFSGCQKEILYLQNEINEEKTKYSELEMVQSKERVTMQEQSVRIKKLEREKEEMEGELGKCFEKIQELYH